MLAWVRALRRVQPRQELFGLGREEFKRGRGKEEGMDRKRRKDKKKNNKNKKRGQGHEDKKWKRRKG